MFMLKFLSITFLPIYNLLVILNLFLFNISKKLTISFNKYNTMIVFIQNSLEKIYRVVHVISTLAY